MEIMPDLALAAMLFVPFVVTFVALKVILFDPLLAYLEQREHAIVGAKDEAHALDKDADARAVELDKRLSGARDEVVAIRGAARKRAADQQTLILGEARKRAEERVAHALAEIERERAKASAQIQPLAADISREVASTVLGRPV